MGPLQVFSSLKGIWCSVQHVNCPSLQKLLLWKAEHYITGKCLEKGLLYGSVGNAKKVQRMFRVWHLFRARLPSALSTLYAAEPKRSQMKAFRKLQHIFRFILWHCNHTELLQQSAPLRLDKFILSYYKGNFVGMCSMSQQWQTLSGLTLLDFSVWLMKCLLIDNAKVMLFLVRKFSTLGWKTHWEDLALISCLS